MAEKRKAFKFITSLPDGERCVSMIEFKGNVYLATEKRVYVLIEGELKPVEIVFEEK